MDNFVFVMDKMNPDKKYKYEIKDGVVHVYGIQHGYFRIKEEFSNYKFHSERRCTGRNWKSKRRNFSAHTIAGYGLTGMFTSTA